MEYKAYIPQLLFVLKIAGAALFGFMLSIGLDIYRSGVELKKLSWSEWKDKNFVKSIVSVGCIIAGLVFSEDIFGAPITSLMAFWAGFGSDKLVNDLVRRREKLRKKAEESEKQE